MPQIIKPRRTTTPGKVPTTSDVADGEMSVNVADGKLYVRVGSTIYEIGSSAVAGVAAPTDKPPTSINGRSNTTTTSISTADAQVLGAPVASGAMTANTYKSVLTLSAPGVLKLAAVWTTDSTSRAIGIQIIIDGVTAIDLTGAAVAQASRGLCPVGILGLIQGIAALDRIPFNTLTVQIKSSVTETDKLQSLILYDLV